MGFDGYSEEIKDYLTGLKANNNKDWFTKNRTRFDDLVIAPSVALASELAEPLSKLNPDLRAEPKLNGSIRRIYRDTRFSKDKTPYQTYLHLIFWAGDHPNRSPGVHIILAPDHFGYGAGHWGFEAEQLTRYRVNIAGDQGKSVQKAVDAVLTSGTELSAPELARVPSGFDKQAPWAQWARHKGLVVRSGDQPYPAEIFTRQAAEHILGICRDMAPLTRYLVENVYE